MTVETSTAWLVISITIGVALLVLGVCIWIIIREHRKFKGMDRKASEILDRKRKEFGLE